MKLNVLRNNEQILEKDLSQEINLSSDVPLTFFIGRSSDCLIRLDDRKVSREHAQIIFDKGNWSIKNVSEYTDSISINGTYIKDKLLEDSDFLTIGPYEINIFITQEDLDLKEALDEQTKDESPSEEGTKTEIGDEETVESEIIDGANEEEVTDLEEGEFGSDEGDSSEEGQESDDDDDDDPFNELGDDKEAEKEDSFAAEDSEGESGDFSDGDGGGESEEGGFDDDGGGFDDGGFDDGGFDEGGGMDMATTDEKTSEIKFATYELTLRGEGVPYDKFTIADGETLIGRDPKTCQLVLDNSEVSSQHAKIIKTKIDCHLEDLKSGNGTYINENRINKTELKDKDTFRIGDIHLTLAIRSDFLSEQSGILMPVEENQEIEVEEIIEVDESFGDEEGEEGAEGVEGSGEVDDGKKKSLIQQIKTDPKKRKIAIVVVGALLVLMLSDSEPEKPKAKSKSAKAKDAKGKTTGKTGKKGKAGEKKKFTPEQLEFLDSAYLLAKELFQRGKYSETLFELQKVFSITKEYKNAQQIYSLAKQGLAKLEEIEKKRIEEIDRKKRVKRTKELIVRAKKAVDEKQHQVATSLFGQILKLDPENYEVPQMKLEIDAYKSEKKRKEDEARKKTEERNKKVTQIQPSKKFYLAKEWFKAILKIQEFLKIQPMDEDLIKEATNMLSDSKKQMRNLIGPLLSKARNLGEGEDLKGAYEIYNKILFHDPTHEESINEMGRIKELLHTRAQKIYRHAIISESLSLFEDAKEKFQEVQQISPSDSLYYKKATKKLKEYVD